jgi:hypothetical protein
MGGKKAFVPLAIIATMVGVLGTTSAAWSLRDDSEHYATGVKVIPCRLDGINPVWHSEVFGNPAVARAYGFIQSKDGRWQVGPNCIRGRYPDHY